MTPADALFSKTTQRLITALFVDPDAEGVTYAEILRQTSGGSGAIHRELRKFLEAGLIERRAAPWGRAFVANRAHPLCPELHAIAKKLARAAKDKTLDPILARTLAKKYLWWMKPGEAIEEPGRLVAQIMNLGTFEDIRFVEQELGASYLRKVLKDALPGYFEERPWAYWHYRLGLARPGGVPELPRRRLA